jgi:hypothetical protein
MSVQNGLGELFSHIRNGTGLLLHMTIFLMSRNRITARVFFWIRFSLRSSSPFHLPGVGGVFCALPEDLPIHPQQAQTRNGRPFLVRQVDKRGDGLRIEQHEIGFRTKKKREKEGTGNRPPTLASLSWYGIPFHWRAVGTALREKGGYGFETTTAMMTASASSWLAVGARRDPSGCCWTGSSISPFAWGRGACFVYIRNGAEEGRI